MDRLCGIQYNGKEYTGCVILCFNVMVFIETGDYPHLGLLSLSICNEDTGNISYVNFSLFSTYEEFIAWVKKASETIEGIHLSGNGVGFDELALYVSSDLIRSFRQLLVQDTAKHTGFPREIINTQFFSSSLKDCFDIYPQPVRAVELGDTKVFLGHATISDFSENLLTEDCSVESFILGYLSMTGFKSYDYLCYILDNLVGTDSIKASDFGLGTGKKFICRDDDGNFVYYNKSYFENRGVVSAYITPSYRYDLHKRAVYQSLYCPLFISESGSLVFGYISDDNMVEKYIDRYLYYKIPDIAKFNRFLTKYTVLRGS